MNKQTAVEWLENEFQEIFKEWGGLDTIWIKRFEQAKAMEKEHIIHTYWVAYKEGRYSGDKTAEEYYNETYGK